jgi:hypothetical protein
LKASLIINEEHSDGGRPQTKAIINSHHSATLNIHSGDSMYVPTSLIGICSTLWLM